MGHYPDSVSSLKAWTQNIEQNTFKRFVQLRQAFAAADYVSPYTVFNIAGNKYRLIAVVSYALGAVSVEHVLTHAQYDKDQWRI
jgi:mRNA interferase HigB